MSERSDNENNKREEIFWDSSEAVTPKGESEKQPAEDAPAEDAPAEDASAEEAHAEEAPPAESHVIYRWNWDEQLRYDRAAEQKKKRRGVFTFAAVMSAVFLLCIATLIGVILLTGSWASAGSGHTDIGAVAEAVNPATVLIECTAENGGINYGTGFFIKENGYIATNHHVIKSALTVKVRLYSGRTLMAKVVGYYAPDDLAVIKVEGSGYPTLMPGNSDAIRVGDTVVAVGNPSGADAAWTTTHGIVSATERRVLVSEGDFTGTMKMIQTDAPVNPGNSGGPLCDMRGRVIGIVTQKLSGYEGMGFAIPINEAMETLQAIMDGRVDSFTSSATQKRPSIGITVENIVAGKEYTVDGETYEAPYSGMLIAEVVAGSGADGVLLYGDLLYEFDGVSVPNAQVLQNELFKKKIGDSVKVKIYRTGAELEVTVKLS